jgi:DNA-binding FrmR family transcriptional regulator
MEIVQLGEETLAGAQRRLRKVEGQVRAIQRMIDEGRECEEVLRQVAAASKALRRVGVNLAVSGLQHCVEDGQEADQDLERLRRSFLELS